MDVGIGPIVVVIAFLVMIMAVPIWPWARPFGYRPTIILGIVFMMIAVFVAIGGFGSF
ncbi:hypothetical protein FP2506_03945 [Fulvimarina pelagi HTCC2506]|uniref:DUF3309 domain-containing protein n=2 Tax=Fulvimarina pelagi TaxID=217511 RepID=Q0FZC9_9HYPH|nr:DUF3309 family protein [Fulvimarina pelagi]EAU40349.1 hypothetical protein FP2506_03945 [Fulvimarina pelagi HTCC2506]BAT31386.1 hypothetical protein [Fulvimarina pelagi]